MSSALRALVLSPEAPYPMHGGGQLRIASILEYLRRRYAVEVLAFREPGAPVPEFPPDMRGHVIELPWHSKSGPSRVLRNLDRGLRGVPPLLDRFAGREPELASILRGRRFDVGIVEHFWCAPYWSVLRPACDRLIIDLVDVDSVLLRRQAVGLKAPLFRRFASASGALERHWLPKYDGVMVCSPADAIHVDGPSVVYPNTVPFTALPQAVKQDCIAFSGNMEYEPNRTGIRWFHANVWPKLRQRVRWKLIGRNEHAIREIVGGDDRIEVTGAVPDAIAELATAHAAVVPILAGSGTRVKILEAWAAGLAVVSTSIGAEGLPTEAMSIADSADEFATAVLRVLDNDELRGRMEQDGRRTYEERFTWQAAWGTLEAWGL